MTNKYENLQINDVIIFEGLLHIEWFSRDIGYGNISLKPGKDNIIIDTEAMSKEFVKALFNVLIDKAIIK